MDAKVYELKLDKIIKDFYTNLKILDEGFVEEFYRDWDYDSSSFLRGSEKYIGIVLKDRSLIVIDVDRNCKSRDESILVFKRLDRGNNPELFYEITHLGDNCFAGVGFIEHTIKIDRFEDYLFKEWLLRNI